MTHKKKIRLTEEKLRRIVRNCVKSALNELDPRTYASYAANRFKQGDKELQWGDFRKADQYLDKASQGVRAAQKEWNRRYGDACYYPGNGYDCGPRYYSKYMGGMSGDVPSDSYNAPYVVNYNSDTQQRSYNPKTNKEWEKTYGMDDSISPSYEFDFNTHPDLLDLDSYGEGYKVARQMQHPHPERDFDKKTGKWITR